VPWERILEVSPSSPTQIAKERGAALCGRLWSLILPYTSGDRGGGAGEPKSVIDHAMLRLGSAANPQLAAPNLLLFFDIILYGHPLMGGQRLANRLPAPVISVLPEPVLDDMQDMVGEHRDKQMRIGATLYLMKIRPELQRRL
jgi:hypothetical protein